MGSLFANPFAVEKHSFTTRLGPSLCRAKLASELFSWDTVDRYSPLNLPWRIPVAGEVTKDGFSLRKFARYKRPTDPLVWGDFRQESEGTRVTVRVAMRRKIAFFFVFWFAFFILMQIGLLLGLIGAGPAPETFPGIWLPGTLVAVGGIAYFLSRTAAQRDAEYVLSFLRHTLQAEAQSPNGASGEVTRP